MQEISNTWEGWKSQLAAAVKIGENLNLSPDQIAQRAQQIGDFLAKNVDPRNPEQKVLQELWQAADEDERQAIAGALVKLVSNNQTH